MSNQDTISLVIVFYAGKCQFAFVAKRFVNIILGILTNTSTQEILTHFE